MPPNSSSPAPATTQTKSQARRKNTKRFHCSSCQRHFGRLEHLQRHEITHTQERPFGCGLCTSRFTRSDLLVRHERLSHNNGKSASRTSRLSSNATGENLHDEQSNGSAEAPAGASPHNNPSQSRPNTNHDTTQDEPIMQAIPESPMATLYMAAQQKALQDSVADQDAQVQLNGVSATMPMDCFGQDHSQPEMAAPLPPPTVPDSGFLPHNLDFDAFSDTFSNFLEAAPLQSFHFSSLVTTEQPMPFFSPQSFLDVGDMLDGMETQAPQNEQHQWQTGILEDPGSFSRFGSRLPSLQPEESTPEPHQQRYLKSQHQPAPTPKHVSDVSLDDRQLMLAAISEFKSVPSDFRLPTRLTLGRYIRAYVNGFHEHLPFLHIHTMRVSGCSVELILAMAAVGAQYCFEAEEGLGLFHAARAIATERIRRRDRRIASWQRTYGHQYSTSPSEYAASSPTDTEQHESSSTYTFNGPLGLPSHREGSVVAAPNRDDLMQSAQALLILMAMATWAKHKEILREALAIQSVLASIVRDDGLRQQPQEASHRSWEDWARDESILRTKYIVYCFFNLHSIVYDIPPLILNSELNMRLPCNAAEFKAPSAAQWSEAAKKPSEIMQFQDSLRRLFAENGEDSTRCHTALGNYILIHAIIQHIFFIRQTARCRFDTSELTAEEVAPLDQALKNWQLGWKLSPESSVNPMDPNGPVAFNSTALLRLAYIRLNMDSGPGRALGTRDPLQIARALRETPAVKRNPKLMRALLHSAHALSIPVKIGIRLVAKTQTFIWSIQHSLCSLECALLLGKWLETISTLGPEPDPPLTINEKRILSLVRTVIGETEFRVSEGEHFNVPEMAKHLNAGVLRVWAAIFRGAQTWAIVDVIGSALNIYADMLEAA